MKRIDKFIYGSGRFGSSLLIQLVSFLTFYLYFEIFLLDPILNGVANGLGKLTIAFSSFYWGYLSDKTKTRWGRRKPYILIGSPLLAFSFIMLFTPHLFGLSMTKFFGLIIGDDISLFIYLTVFVCMFNFFYGFLLSPYQCIMPEVTEESERIEVSGYENMFGIFAIGISSFVSFFFPTIFGRSSRIFTIFPLMILIFALMEIGFYIMPFIKIKEPKIEISPRDLKEELKVAWKNKNFMWYQLFQGFTSISTVIAMNSLLGFVENILRFSTTEYLIAAGLLALVIMAMWIYWGWISRVKSKHFSLLTSSIMFACVIPFTLFGQLSGEVGLIFGYILISLAAAGISSLFLFPYVILADIAEDDYLKTGINRAGLYYGVRELYLNLFQAAANVITGFIFILPLIPVELTEANMRTLVLLFGTPPDLQPLVVLLFLTEKIAFSFPMPISTGYLFFGPVTALFMIPGILVFAKKVKIDFNLEERKKRVKKSKN